MFFTLTFEGPMGKINKSNSILMGFSAATDLCPKSMQMVELVGLEMTLAII
jgi:hypothetical protein